MLILDDEKKFFEFSIGKKTYKVTDINSLPLEQYEELAEKLVNKKPIEVIKVVTDLFEQEVPGCTKTLTVRQADKLVSEYLKPATGATVGE